MNTVDLVINSVETFYNEIRKDPNGRYRSWEYCYKSFHDARNNKNADADYLSLQLAFYLASWGMYRGSSFLLQKDYRIHIPVIEEILKPEYNELFGIQCSNLKERKYQEKLIALEVFMTKYYGVVRESVKEKTVQSSTSTILITKILMGTLGCVPAYDRYFVDGIKAQKVSTGNYNIKSVLRLVDFYEVNENRLEEERSKLKAFGLLYPQMKILDMGFWQIGFDMDIEKGFQNAH